MKQLRVTVNGKSYDVQVEILQDDEGHYPGAPHAAPPAPAPAAVPVYSPPPTAAATRPAAGPGALCAPIVGTVTKVLVEAGAEVKTNQKLIVLDAMKMDTYINAPRDGVIDSVDCKVGDAVQVGQRLVTFR
ncbi:MAG TPA: acetyl-CoA carboxylase biotin carboxyl carrier protein subunit [Acidobacteriota bacterium]|jgi:biotin carboxyl carrier protein|nr:acetyl-CoA carboxylase biotin carboxyl carrier protein subunit [Acidobacteriota bacterium]HNR39181.1 acetyl-CoA carboxylase biotin carboxyl carrier protein subunit [Acidobacteriota bacterium]HNU01384.1 acetyl-CoA carboxylase biotin carboxyl carrier protein subunit [Acidobacteriota bacterium]HPB29068.1 acetyl-CoA carboxylase biotin carboxyl carrier protein subunit [Acidobacteriota bacterium]HQO25938.1 acetyl-CoA carboxylase biotin carboxyl carrier protein subunit [Acidobacteriota bacterium]